MKNINAYILEKLKLNKDTKVFSFAENLIDTICPKVSKDEREKILEVVRDWLEGHNIDKEIFNNKVSIFSRHYKEEKKYLNSNIKDTEFKDNIIYDNIFLKNDIDNMKYPHYHVYESKTINIWVDGNRLLLHNFKYYGTEYYLLFIYEDYGPLG